MSHFTFVQSRFLTLELLDRSEVYEMNRCFMKSATESTDTGVCQYEPDTEQRGPRHRQQYSRVRTTTEIPASTSEHYETDACIILSLMRLAAQCAKANSLMERKCKPKATSMKRRLAMIATLFGNFSKVA